MTTYWLDLLFLGDPKAELPGPPRVFVCLKHWSSIEAAKDTPLITPDCVSLKELEYQINVLHKELDAILLKAKRKFTVYDKKQGEHLGQRKSEPSSSPH